MADSRFSSMAAMMGGTGGAAPVPTQNFNAANILGTPIPVVGNNKGVTGNAPLAGSVGQQIPKIQIVLVAVGLIGIGYLAYHFNFEK